MQLSNKTLSVLKNFAGFNGHILIEEGSVLKTMTAQKNVLAKATVEEEFPREIPIYDLSEFINALSLVDNPELEFDETCVKISGNGDNKTTLRYFYADKSVLVYPDKDINFGKADVAFDLPYNKLEKVLSASRVLNLPSVTLVCQDNQLMLRAHDAANSASNKFDLPLMEIESKDFNAHFKVENLRFLELDYHVELNLKGIARFTNKENKIEYLVGLSTK